MRDRPTRNMALTRAKSFVHLFRNKGSTVPVFRFPMRPNRCSNLHPPNTPPFIAGFLALDRGHFACTSSAVDSALVHFMKRACPGKILPAPSALGQFVLPFRLQELQKSLNRIVFRLNFRLSIPKPLRPSIADPVVIVKLEIKVNVSRFVELRSRWAKLKVECRIPPSLTRCSKTPMQRLFTAI